MPRLPHTLIRQAARRSPLLPLLLRECRDLESAQNELRWLKEHATAASLPSKSARRKILLDNVQRRGRGEPLQYILGNQPFGDVEILCKRNVLIPRPETETYTRGLAALLNQLRADPVTSEDETLRILDLCTGTGCVPLLLHHLLRKSDQTGSGTGTLQIMGVDLSESALRLSRLNLLHNIRCGVLDQGASDEVQFRSANVLELGKPGTSVSRDPSRGFSELSKIPPWEGHRQWDVIISNPPYISPIDYAPGGQTSSSVRRFEPRMALVPPRQTSIGYVANMDHHQADQFYHSILAIAIKVRAKLVIMEIGDNEQSRRVQALVRDLILRRDASARLENWKDDGTTSMIPAEDGIDASPRGDSTTESPDRAVVVWRDGWAVWRSSMLDGAMNCP